MWCVDCQQDVPGVRPAVSKGVIVCARCSRELAHPGQASSQSGRLPETTGATTADKPAAVNEKLVGENFDAELADWKLTDNLERARRAVYRHARWPMDSNSQSAAVSTDPTSLPPESRVPDHRFLHAGHRSSEAPHYLARQNPAGLPSVTRIVAWTFVVLGVATCSAGFVMSGMSFMSGWDHLWNLGLPMALIGQAAVLFGLVLQLDGLWRVNRHTNRSLEELDYRIAELRQAAAHSQSHERNLWSAYPQIGTGLTNLHMPSDGLRGPTAPFREHVSGHKE